MPLPFLQQRGNLAEQARQLDLKAYAPRIELQGLVPGVDNVRHDVYLSPTFCETARAHIARLIARYGNVEDLAADVSAVAVPAPGLRPQEHRPRASGEAADFKRLLTDLLVAALNRSKKEENASLDLLARLAVLKFLRSELVAQFSSTLERVRTRQKAYEGPRHLQNPKAVEIRERCAAFQLAKKPVIRKTGQELFQTLRDIEKEILARTRRALLGDSDQPAYHLLLNRLMFTEEGRDDYINAEHYVMLGNFDRDPDRFLAMQEIAHAFLTSLGWAPDTGRTGPEVDHILNVPENALELVGGGTPDESTPQGKIQKALLAAWVEILERSAVMEHIIGAYEAVALLGQYSPPVNAQQLKNALINKAERQRVEKLLDEGRIPADNLLAAVRRVGYCRGPERAKLAGRFLLDFMRYHRDLRSLEALNAVLDSVSLISNEKLRELSAINHTLYEFLLAEELKPAEEKVTHHVVLKADIRDSTAMTRTLMERGQNPASYFSLNFYEPVNKLLAKYRARKVFIEGDAVILAMFGYESETSQVVGQACVLAREIISIVRGYNEQSQKAGLPILELGIGICYEASPPMYLMDSSAPIMISQALNESDRLSSCNRGARRFLAEGASLFNVYAFKTVDDEDTGGDPDAFLMRYNLGGINLSEAAFQKLQREISLQAHEMQMPTLWGQEVVRLYSGLVPLGGQMFHRIVVREGIIARIEAADFAFHKWTEQRYYEVCTNDAIYEPLESGARTEASVGR